MASNSSPPIAYGTPTVCDFQQSNVYPLKERTSSEIKSTAMTGLASKAVDSNILRRKQTGNNQTTQDTIEGKDENQLQSKLLVPGSTYLTPTKPTPFKPNDSYPFGLKSSDFTVSPKSDDVHRSEIQLPQNSTSLSSTTTKGTTPPSDLTAPP